MVKVKICGITNTEDAVWVANLGADYLGLVFARDSKRKVSLQKAKEITGAVPPYIQKVGLFVNEEPAVVDKTLALCKLDILQFHGEETADYCNQFKDKARVIKAFRLRPFLKTPPLKELGGSIPVDKEEQEGLSFRIKDEESLNQIPQYDVDFYLLDTFVEGEQGGTGTSFNWDLAIKVKEFGRPIFLAGGLNPDNVAGAVKKVQPYAVDVSSGVESSPRRKSVELMREFIDKVRKIG